ncbi:MAG: hypothetical protein ACRDPV_03885 [Gaiellaceae bacterium]
MDDEQQDVEEPNGFDDRDQDGWSLPRPPVVPAGRVSEVWPAQQLSERSVDEHGREPAA